jgi:hypothetical protein
MATRPQNTSTIRGLSASLSRRLMAPVANAAARIALSDTGPHNDHDNGVNTPGMASPTLVVP